MNKMLSKKGIEAEKKFTKYLSEWIIKSNEIDIKQFQKYQGYTDVARMEKVKAEKEGINKTFAGTLDKFMNDVSADILTAKDKISPLKYPNKETLPTEYQNAILLSQNIPSNLDELMRVAINEKRYEFFFSMFDLVKNDSKFLHKRQGMEKLYTELCEKLGITELNFELIDLMQVYEMAKDIGLRLYMYSDTMKWDTFHSNELERLAEYEKPVYDLLLATKYPKRETFNVNFRK